MPWTKVKSLIRAILTSEKIGMNRESFLEAIRKQFTDEIHSVYLQCEHGKDVDYPQLTHLLSKLRDAAKREGLTYAEFEDLVKSELPGVWECLQLKPKAA